MNFNDEMDVLKRLDLLNEFVFAINACESKTDVYEYLASTLSRLIPAGRTSVAIVGETREFLKILAMPGFASPFANQNIKMSDSLVGQVVLNNKTYVPKDLSLIDSIECTALTSIGYVTAMSTPIHIEGQVIGTINVSSKQKGIYTEKVQRLFETIASLVSNCLERLYFVETSQATQERAKVHARRLKMLTDISVKLSNVQEEDELLGIMCDCLGDIIPVDRINYHVVEQDNEAFRIMHIYADGKLEPSDIVFPMSESALTGVVFSHKPEYYSNFGTEVFQDHDKMQETGMVNAWSIPIISGGRVLRLLNIGARKKPNYVGDLMDIFTILSSLMSVAFDGIFANKTIAYRAHYDLLTDVRNRHSFQERLDRLTNVKAVKPFQLLLIDLDNFKFINDFYGHAAGDKALVEIANLLKSVCKENDIVARLGGDEFAIICEDVEGGEDILDRIYVNSIEITHNERSVNVGFSIGVVRFPHHSKDGHTLTKYADLALYKAKTMPVKIQMFNKGLVRQFNEKIRILTDFKAALLEGRIVPFYQPIVDMKTKKVYGMEALVRWDHKERGILFPADFRDVLDDTELCIQLANFMHRENCKNMKLWKQEGICLHHVGLNVEPTNLMDPAFPLFLLSELHKNDLRPEDYTIEITENSALNEKGENIVQNLESLANAGISIALDDFGTGFSSISHLKNLPISSVKLDKSYVSRVHHNQKDYHIVKAIIELAHQLGISSIAEGIETEEEQDLLSSLACDFGQGYLYSKAVPAKQVPSLIAQINGDELSKNVA